MESALKHHVRTLGLVAALSLSLAACKRPAVVSGLEAGATQEGVTVSVTSAELILPELEGSRGTELAQHPMLALRVNLSNAGAGPINYDLGWTSPQSSQQQSIVVYRGSDPEVDAVDSNQIAEIDLDEYTYLDDPVTSPELVTPGSELEDVVLLTVPPEGTQSLIVSFPPRLFGAEWTLPAYVVIPWAPTEVQGPAAIDQGTAFEGEDFTFEITNVTTVWAMLEDATGEPGISSSPLLKIQFKATNTGEDSMNYRSTHQRGAFAFPVVTLNDGTPLPRATFTSGIKIDDQVAEMMIVNGGESVEDFFLVQRPPQGTTSLRFTYPGKRLGRTGVARFNLNYTWDDPRKPAEWREEGEEEEEAAEEEAAEEAPADDEEAEEAGE